MKLAVVAHAAKRLDGAPPAELRRALADAGFTDPLRFEVAKSKHAPAAVRKALRAKADVVLAWGAMGLCGAVSAS